jgi:hypothetical protein
MTYLKTTTLTLTAAFFALGTAHAYDAPSSFTEIDTDANGQVNFTEYAYDAQLRGQSLTIAMRQFNVISGGEQTFNQEQYTASFAIQGEIEARNTEKTVLMPIESTAVLGEVATGIVIEDTQQDPDTPIDEGTTNETSDNGDAIWEDETAPMNGSDMNAAEMNNSKMNGAGTK